MFRRGIVLLTLCAFSVSAAAQPDKGLVAHWDFNEGKGDVLHDRSSDNNHGKIHGAEWVKCGKGYALRFDGIDDYVNCGRRPSLDIRGAISLEAWVYPAGTPKGEAGVLGKQFSSYLLTYYTNANCYWYICEGGNHCRVGLSPGSWSHIVGTFDGTTMKLYLDGATVGSRQSKHRAINAGRNLFIGCVLGDASADDPAYTRTSYFKGLIDEVRIHTRALSEEEIRNHYQREVENRTVPVLTDFRRVTEGKILRTEALTLTVGDTGATEIAVGKDAYVLESAFSYPAEKIGTNAFAVKPANNEPTWVPRVKKTGKNAIGIRAAGKYYSLQRKIRLRNHRIEVEDTLTNLADGPVGIIIRNKVVAPRVFRKPHLSNAAENPTIFLSQGQSCLGIVAEDTIGRLQFEPMSFSNQSGFELSHFALDVGKSYTFRWAIYPFNKEADYFTFINRIRDDWKSDFTIGGPFQFLDARHSPANNAKALKAFLKRKKLKVVALGPWLDYWTGQDVSRAESKRLLQRAMRIFREVDPEIKCVGEVETDWVSLRPEQIKGFEHLPVHGGGRSGGVALSPSQTKIIDDANLPWADSFKRAANGTLRMELYSYGGRPFSAVNVYPQVGNYQYQFMMEQVKFIIDEVGLDGVYIDDFSQAWGGSYHATTHDKWDGYSVDIDPKTGKIERKYTNGGLAGATARKNLCEYALSRGKIVVANSCAAVHETQSLPVFRFLELYMRSFNPHLLKEGQKPPFLASLSPAHLASPIELGIGGRNLNTDKKNYARGFMKGIITLLRNGLLYYHYDSPIPESGEGSGEYGPINHMFPITPVRLFEGGIEGKERTVTCVSGTYPWRHKQRPKTHLFDINGRAVQHRFALTRAARGYDVTINLEDWEQIAILEQLEEKR